jgi:hypothetical protein
MAKYKIFTVRSSYSRFVFEILKFVSYANLISQKEAIIIGEETKIFKKINYFNYHFESSFTIKFLKFMN